MDIYMCVYECIYEYSFLCTCMYVCMHVETHTQPHTQTQQMNENERLHPISAPVLDLTLRMRMRNWQVYLLRMFQYLIITTKRRIRILNRLKVKLRKKKYFLHCPHTRTFTPTTYVDENYLEK